MQGKYQVCFCKELARTRTIMGTARFAKEKENEVVGKYMPCSSCRVWTKGGTTLACYDCGGLGIVLGTRGHLEKHKS